VERHSGATLRWIRPIAASADPPRRRPLPLFPPTGRTRGGTSSWRVTRIGRPGRQDRTGARAGAAAPRQRRAPGRAGRPEGRAEGGVGDHQHLQKEDRQCKKMARTCFTDILNAFISDGDRTAGQDQSSLHSDWPAGRARSVIGWLTGATIGGACRGHRRAPPGGAGRCT
jgi:hypothetical protein